MDDRTHTSAADVLARAPAVHRFTGTTVARTGKPLGSSAEANVCTELLAGRFCVGSERGKHPREGAAGAPGQEAQPVGDYEPRVGVV